MGDALQEYWQLWNHKERLEAENERLRAENAELVEVLIERDGGAHDSDCKVYRERPCNCGHDLATAALAKAKGEQ